MFKREDMMVSLVVAENEIAKIKREHDESLNLLKGQYVDFINETKRKIGFVGFATLRGKKYSIGDDAGFEIDGVKLYTGDEVRLGGKWDWEMRGKVGIIIMRDGKAYWQSNCESGYMSKSFDYEIVKHYIHHNNGDEVAKGRKGAEGFTIRLEV